MDKHSMRNPVPNDKADKSYRGNEDGRMRENYSESERRHFGSSSVNCRDVRWTFAGEAGIVDTLRDMSSSYCSSSSSSSGPDSTPVTSFKETWEMDDDDDNDEEEDNIAATESRPFLKPLPSSRIRSDKFREHRM